MPPSFTEKLVNAGTDCTATVLGGLKKFWGNNYTYDAWGNLIGKYLLQTPAPAACAGENLSATADAHNWLHSTGGPDYQYDAAGNMTFNATPPTQNYTYDQENRLIGAAGYTYTYDADGNRVRKSNSSSTGTLYWYMTPGIVGESDLNGNLADEYVFFDGERVARKSTNGVFYYFSDHLKTASVITDSAGNIKSESDFYPWGGELQFVANDSNHYKFTGKERDGETQLDYFGARYYSNGLGRWVSADWSPTPIPVPYANFGNPQSLNLYAFVGGNPASTADPDGHATPDGQKHDYARTVCEVCTGQKLLSNIQSRIDQGVQEHYIGQLQSAAEKTAINTLIDLNNLGNQLACAMNPKCHHPKLILHLLIASSPEEAETMRQMAITLFFLPGGEEEGAANLVREAGDTHHLLPQQFKAIFESVGLDIEKYTIKLSPSAHRLKPDGLHTIGGGNWNKVWKEFLAHPDNQTEERILQQLDKMIEQFRLKGPS